MSSRKKKPVFVLVIPRFEDIFHSYYAGEIIRGVSLSASRLNADFLIRITDRANHQSWLDSSLMDRNYIDGIIFADIDNDLGVVKKAIRWGMPCIVLNNMIDDPINYVAVDNHSAALGVVEHLLRSGHNRIATVAGDVSTQAGLKRLDGYREALRQHDINVPRSYVTFGEFLRTPARVAARRLLKLKNRPTAIFVASDVMALEVIDVARSLGISVPEELSIIGFDNNPFSVSGPLKLTTVSQPLVEMGRLGAEKLFQVTQGKIQLPTKTLLPTKLIKRQSVSEAKGRGSSK